MAKYVGYKRPKDTKKTIRHLLVYLGMHKWSFLLVALLVFISAGANITGTYLLKPVINRFIVPGDLNGLVRAVAAMGVMYLCGALATLGYNRLMVKTSQKVIREIRENIIYHIAYIESALDDPEHISVDGYGEILKGVSEEIIEKLQKLIDSADDGRIMKEGIQTVIVGKPNAGKSSLLNLLAGHERAIVTDIAGTTRDVLEEQIRLQGLNLNVIDTAGIRQTEDLVEKMGVDKAKEYAQKADLIIYVVDASKKLDENDEKIMRLIYDKKAIILLNKSDLETVVDENLIREKISNLKKEAEQTEKSEGQRYQVSENIPVIQISAKEEQGIQTFQDTLKEMFLRGNISFNEEIYITNARQKNALVNALESMKKVIESIENGMPEDFYSIDLMDAYEELGNITGESMGEDLVNEIFSKFCMGK